MVHETQFINVEQYSKDVSVDNRQVTKLKYVRPREVEYGSIFEKNLDGKFVTYSKDDSGNLVRDANGTE